MNTKIVLIAVLLGFLAVCDAHNKSQHLLRPPSKNDIHECIFDIQQDIQYLNVLVADLRNGDVSRFVTDFEIWVQMLNNTFKDCTERRQQNHWKLKEREEQKAINNTWKCIQDLYALVPKVMVLVDAISTMNMTKIQETVFELIPLVMATLKDCQENKQHPQYHHYQKYAMELLMAGIMKDLLNDRASTEFKNLTNSTNATHWGWGRQSWNRTNTTNATGWGNPSWNRTNSTNSSGWNWERHHWNWTNNTNGTGWNWERNHWNRTNGTNSSGWGRNYWNSTNRTGWEWDRQHWNQTNTTNHSGWGRYNWNGTNSTNATWGWERHHWNRTNHTNHSGWERNHWNTTNSTGWGKQHWNHTNSTNWNWERHHWNTTNATAWGNPHWNNTRTWGTPSWNTTNTTNATNTKTEGFPDLPIAPIKINITINRSLPGNQTWRKSLTERARNLW